MFHPFTKRAKKIWLKIIAPYLCFPLFLKFMIGVWSPVWSYMSMRSCTPISTGLKKGKSCVTQLLEVFHEIGSALDRGFESDIIYLDFAKAFDSVCPAKLVSKLKAFGIGDPLLKWFQSYLTERKQRVVVNGTYSAWTDVGSLLGPILFLLFVNDMPRVVENAKLAMFADDSKCFKVIYQESDFVNLQRDLDALFTWSVSNELFSQPTKCVNLRISRKRNSPSRNYSLNGISLEVVKAEKDLGVLISSDMT